MPRLSDADRLDLVAVRADTARLAVAARDDAVRAAAKAGLSLRSIGERAGMSHGGIAYIVRDVVRGGETRQKR